VSRANYLFTSESVSEGHPDKVCDQISDAILDAFIANDVKLGIADDSLQNTRLGCETLCTTNKIVIAGEGRGREPFFKKHGNKSVVNREMIAEIARNTVKTSATIRMLLLLWRRYRGSPARPVARHRDGRRRQEKEGRRTGGRRDQGMMFGFAAPRARSREGLVSCRRRLTLRTIFSSALDKRRGGQLADLQPDAKSQVTVKYVDGKPVGCTKVVCRRSTMRGNRNKKKYTPGMSRT